MSATVSIILDTRRIKTKTSKFPVKLRVRFNRIRNDYQTIYNLAREDYEKLSASRVSDELQKIRDSLKEIKRKAELFITDLDSFSFDVFKSEFVQNNISLRHRNLKHKIENNHAFDFDVSPFINKFPIFTEDHSRSCSISLAFQKYIIVLLQQDRVGSALIYQDAYNSIKKFRGNVLFTDINVNFLVQYEQWMKARGRSKSTVGVKLRSLRCIFNEAIEDGMVKQKNYPFGRRKYIIPKGRNNKRALFSEQIGKIYNANLECPNEQKARDYWMFMYFANGMNPKDLAYLKNKNIDGDYLTFIRAKSERTTKDDPRPITIYINDDMSNILNKWGNQDKRPESYLFPIIENELTSLEKHYVVRSLIKYINDRMKSITKRLGIVNKVTTIVSRHSFSTQLKRSGVSTEYIQEALGHTDIRTTENYLESFEKEVKKKFSSLLSAFKEGSQVQIESSRRIF